MRRDTAYNLHTEQPANSKNPLLFAAATIGDRFFPSAFHIWFHSSKLIIMSPIWQPAKTSVFVESTGGVQEYKYLQSVIYCQWVSDGSQAPHSRLYDQWKKWVSLLLGFFPGWWMVNTGDKNVPHQLFTENKQIFKIIHSHSPYSTPDPMISVINLTLIFWTLKPGLAINLWKQKKKSQATASH